MTMRYLLDIQVWVALLDEAHLYHQHALAFIHKGLPIATCPIVENGLLRVFNLPGYSKLGPQGFERVIEKYRVVCKASDHEFWMDSVSLCQPQTIHWAGISGQQQVTDVYLLALAVSRQGCLVTMDQRLTADAVQGATSSNLLHLQQGSDLLG